MQTEDSEKTWNDYYQRKKNQRNSEALEIWRRMNNSGVTEETVLALDFEHFGSSKQNIENLAAQLSENYEIQVVPSNEEGCWLAKGTTRPYGITMNEQQLLGWAEFMSDVAQSYSCVFSTWSLESPKLGLHFHSEEIESVS
jgi:hypothetical protein